MVYYYMKFKHCYLFERLADSEDKFYDAVY